MLFSFVTSFSKELKIGLFEKKPISRLTIKYNIGRYAMFTEKKKFTTLSSKRNVLELKAYKNKVIFYVNGVNKGTSTWFRMDKLSNKNSLILKPYSNDLKYRGKGGGGRRNVQQLIFSFFRFVSNHDNGIESPPHTPRKGRLANEMGFKRCNPRNAWTVQKAFASSSFALACGIKCGIHVER